VFTQDHNVVFGVRELGSSSDDSPGGRCWWSPLPSQSPRRPGKKPRTVPRAGDQAERRMRRGRGRLLRRRQHPLQANGERKIGQLARQARLPRSRRDRDQV